MTARETAESVLAALRGSGLPEVEVYLKTGRSRRVTAGREGEGHQAISEEGWAVRAGDRRSSFFAAGSGAPDPAGPWPALEGLPVLLPDPLPVVRWSEPADLAAPLLSEREAQALLAGIEQAVGAELAGVRLVEASLEEGASESSLASSRGLRVESRQRLAWVRLVAALPDSGVEATVEQGVREARRLQPKALARALADRLTVLARGAPPDEPLGEVVLAPAVAARLLAALQPLLVGPGALDRVAPLLDSERRLGSPLLTVIDDGRLAGGLLASAVDGEGVPTRALPIVESGIYRQPLLAWWQARSTGMVSSGCTARPGFRDLPRPAATHLFVRAQEGVRPAQLVADLGRGCYVMDAHGAARWDAEADRFALRVSGFVVEGGAARRPVAGAWLRGRLSALLRGVVGVARDLTFLPFGALVGSPTLRVTGVEVAAEP
jgi:PmbA protein